MLGDAFGSPGAERAEWLGRQFGQLPEQRQGIIHRAVAKDDDGAPDSASLRQGRSGDRAIWEISASQQVLRPPATAQIGDGNRPFRIERPFENSLEQGPQSIELVRRPFQREAVALPATFGVLEDHHAAGRLQQLERTTKEKIRRHLPNMTRLQRVWHDSNPSPTQRNALLSSHGRGPGKGLDEQEPAGAPASMPTTTTVAESPSVAPASRSRRGPRLLVIGIIVLVLLVVIGYVLGGAAAAAGPVGNADKALRNTVDHENTVVDVLNQDPLKGLDLSSSANIPQAKAAMTAYKQKLSRVEPTVSADRAALRSARPQLQSSFLTLPEQGTVNHDRKRVDAALAALRSAQRGIDISKRQVDFLNAVFDAAANFDELGKRMQASDLSGTASQLPVTSDSVKKAIALAEPPDVPAAFMPFLKAMQQAADDLQKFITAVQAGDSANVQKYLAAVQADGNALGATDQNSINKAENDLFQPLIDNYNAQMKIASS